VAAQVVAVTQAGLWATHLLGPDLVAAALMLAALAMMIATPWSATRAVAVGAIFGLAYFGKAFMLPFAALVTPVLLWLRRSMHAPGAPAVRWWRDCALVLLGLTIVAGPWIAVLSVKYGGFTFSTAGAANHANLGPHARGLDLLWNPLLEANYILEPHFGPDWSPFASLRNFGHQVFLVAFNVWKALGQIVGYVVLLAVAIVWRRACVRRGAVPPLAAIERARLRQCLLASAIYLLGYSAVDIERRYHVPMLAPLLAVAALSLLAPCLPSARWSMARTLGAAVLSMVPFAGQEIRLLWVTCDRHPQSWNVEGPRADVRALRDAGWDGAAFAASDWHRGLAVAYVSGALGAYLGRPLAPTPAERGHQLRRAGARYFVQFAPGAGEAEACLDPAWRPAPSSRRSGVQVLIDTRGVEPAANSGPEAFRGR